MRHSAPPARTQEDALSASEQLSAEPLSGVLSSAQPVQQKLAILYGNTKREKTHLVIFWEDATALEPKQTPYLNPRCTVVFNTPLYRMAI